MCETTMLIIFGICLTGCAYTCDIYLTGRTSGITAHTKVVVTTGHSSGDVTLTINGKTYTGRWVYVSGSGSLNLATATVVSGSHVGSTTGMAVGLPSGGNGTMNLKAPDGSTLRCVYDYSEWSSSGVGVCQGNDGEVYDV